MVMDVPPEVNEQVVPSLLFTAPVKVMALAVDAETVIIESVSPVLHE